MTKPLSDITVLDLTWVLSGPFASMILADMGANVIKVERPPYGDVARTTGPYIGDESGYFFSINRGKKSICLDLKNDQGRELFLRLAEKADVVTENFTPGTMDALGVGYGTLAARNPRLVYAATSGFGQTGPDRDRPALDIIVQGMGGIMSITGEPGGPPVRPGNSQGDITAGLYTAIGVLTALHERERSGKGQMVDVSMLDCQIAILENAFVRYFATGEPPKPIGTRHPLTTPFQAFPTKDGWIVIAISWGVENQWELFCATIDRPALIGDERFETPGLRTKQHAVLEPMLNDALKAKTTDEWLREFDAHRPAVRAAQRHPPRRRAAAGEGARHAGRRRAPIGRLAAHPRHAGQAGPHARRHRRPAARARGAYRRGAVGAAGIIREGDRVVARSEGGIRTAAQSGATRAGSGEGGLGGR